MKAPARRGSAGFTLVELMISMTLGLLIILALITMLINVNRNNSELSYSNRLIENGRFATQILASDIQHAGFWGGHVPNYDDMTYTDAPDLATVAGGQVPTAVPEPCTPYNVGTWTSEYVANLIGVHIQGSDIPASLTAPFCSGVITNPKANTDVLVVRHAEGCVAGSGSAECSDTTGAAFPDVYFQASRCGTDTETFVLGTTGLNLHNRDCETGTATIAPIRRFASTLYYVKDDGTNPPTLMRSTFAATTSAAATHQPAQPLVENVESFRVEFGIDNKSDSGGTVTFTAEVNWADPKNKTSPTNRGDGIPDGAYVRCTQAAPCSAEDMANTVAAKIYILVRAERRTASYQDTKTYRMGSVTAGPFNDGYKRHLFTQTVRLVNVSGRRETP